MPVYYTLANTLLLDIGTSPFTLPSSSLHLEANATRSPLLLASSLLLETNATSPFTLTAASSSSLGDYMTWLLMLLDSNLPLEANATRSPLPLLSKMVPIPVFTKSSSSLRQRGDRKPIPSKCCIPVVDV
jgi:hypothetical protein